MLIELVIQVMRQVIGIYSSISLLIEKIFNNFIHLSILEKQCKVIFVVIWFNVEDISFNGYIFNGNTSFYINRMNFL